MGLCDASMPTPKRLAFVAKSDTIGMYKHVKTMQGTFVLKTYADYITNSYVRWT